MSDDALLTTAQLLEFLQIGRTKLWGLVRGGEIPAFRIGNGPNAPLRFRRKDVNRWLEGQRVSRSGSGSKIDLLRTRPSP